MFNYLNFLVQEKRNYLERDKNSSESQIMNFLKGWKYQPGHSSNIFVAFKTGDFETLIPPISLGGSKYTSPQGFYCFDMNEFKNDLFGDGNPIVKRFIDIDNFYGKSDFGLGYANSNGYKSKNNKISGSLPRYLYFIKVKAPKKILSRAFNPEDIFGPFLHFLKYYGNQLLVENKSGIFSLKLKMTNEESKNLYGSLKFYDSSKENLIVISDWFKSNSDKFRRVESISYFLRYPKTKNLYSSFYDLMISLANSISGKNVFVRVNLMFNACGIDGFTQWEDNRYIHSHPPNQSLLLNESCVLEKIKIDRAQNNFNGDISVSQHEDWLEENDIKDSDIVKLGKKYKRIHTKVDPNIKVRQWKRNKSNSYRKLNEGEQLIVDFVNNMGTGDIIKIKENKIKSYSAYKYIIKRKDGKFILLFRKIGHSIQSIQSIQSTPSIKNDLYVDGVRKGYETDIYFQLRDFIEKDINNDILFDTTLFNDSSFLYYDKYKNELNISIDEFADKQQVTYFKNEEEIIHEIISKANVEFPDSDETLKILFDDIEKITDREIMELLDNIKDNKKYYSNNSYESPVWSCKNLHGELKKIKEN